MSSCADDRCKPAAWTVPVTRSIRRLLVAAVATGVVAACAPDDSLTAPRPTVPAVTTAPPSTVPEELGAGSTDTENPPPAGLEESDRDTDGRQGTGAGESAPGEQAPGTPEPSSGRGESSDPGPDRGGVRPDGNMFAADVGAQEVLTLNEPIDMAVAPGDNLLWIAERAGRVLRVDMERGEAVETILDITAETEAAGERGLLGIAVTDRWLFANFTDLEGDTRVDAFERDGTGLSGRRRTILFQPQPFRNHNGGDLAVGPDGLLYVGFGDAARGETRSTPARTPRRGWGPSCESSRHPTAPSRTPCQRTIPSPATIRARRAVPRSS